MSFFYTYKKGVIIIRIYLDLIFMMNIFFDFILIFSINYILKRKAKLFRMILSALFGSLSILLLFISINSFTLFFIKLIISILMIIISFGYKNVKYFFKNLYYLYFISILLGGFLYFIDISLYYKHEGIIFFNNNLSVNFIVMVIISPIIIYLYIENKKEEKNYNKYYNVELLIDKKKLVLNGFLDTGNKIKSYSGYPVILINKNLIKIKNQKIIYIPYNTVNNEGILKCIKQNEIKINNRIIHRKYLIGLIDNINIDGIDIILNSCLMED